MWLLGIPVWFLRHCYGVGGDCERIVCWLLELGRFSAAMVLCVVARAY